MTTAAIKPRACIFDAAHDDPPLVTEDALRDDTLVVILVRLESMRADLRALPKPPRQTGAEVRLHTGFGRLYLAIAELQAAAEAMRRGGADEVRAAAHVKLVGELTERELAHAIASYTVPMGDGAGDREMVEQAEGWEV